MRAKNILLAAFLLLFAVGCATIARTDKRTGLFDNKLENMTHVFKKKIQEGMTMQAVTRLGFDPSSPNVEVQEGMATLEILRQFKGSRVNFSTKEENIKRYAVWIFPHVYTKSKKSSFAIFKKEKKKEGTRTHFVFVFKDGKLLQKGMSASHTSTKSKESGASIFTIPSLFEDAIDLAF